MEALAEQIVATFLTRGGKVFIAPQYAIPAPGSKGDWSCPDIVALDLGAKEVIVVEVATAYNLQDLLSRVKERKSRWFDPIRTKLTADGLSEQAGWPIRFLGFVRRTRLDNAKRSFAKQPDVAFAAIEDATFPWEYWKPRATGGLPR